MNRDDRHLPAAIGLLLASALALQAAPVRAAWPNAELSYADPILFPEQRINNWFEFQMTPVMDGPDDRDDGSMVGMHIHLNTAGTLFTIGMGRRTQELRASYNRAGTLHKTYTFEMRSTWGGANSGPRSSFVFGYGMDWSHKDHSATLPGEESSGDTMVATDLWPGYIVEMRPISGLSLELFVGMTLHTYDALDSVALKRLLVSPTLAFKVSYEVITGGHPVFEMRLPVIINIDDPDKDQAINLDLAFGYRQSWGPLTGGLMFLFNVVGDGQHEDVAMMLDVGLVFF
jgi:hypothetical protein